MSADLVGCLLVGSARIPDDAGTVAEIVRRMDAHAARIKALHRAGRAAGGEDGTTPAGRRLLEALAWRLDGHEGGRLDPVTLAYAFQSMGELPDGLDSTEALARHLIRVWNEALPRAGDVAARPLPGDDGRRMVFAGTCTEDAEPDGTGYVLLRIMHACGFAGAAGIR